MKALVLEKIDDLRIVEREVPLCDESEVLLKVSFCSLCRTDAKMWFQGQRDLVLPRVLGHEICGQTPDSKKHFVVWPAQACKKCPSCLAGVENLCSTIEVMGFHRDGGFAEYIRVPKDSLIAVPAAVPPEIACMTELVSVAVNAAEQVALQEDQRVLIYGGGAAGLLLGLVCSYYGAAPLILEKDSLKREKIRPFCNEAHLDLAEPDAAADAAVDTIAAEFDVVINAAPDAQLFSEGLMRLKAGGTYCLFSGFIKNISFPSDLLNEVHYRQLTLVGAYGSTKRQMETALQILAANAQTIGLLIQDIISLEQVPMVLPEVLQGQALKYVVDLHKGERFGN